MNKLKEQLINSKDQLDKAMTSLLSLPLTDNHVNNLTSLGKMLSDLTTISGKLEEHLKTNYSKYSNLSPEQTEALKTSFDQYTPPQGNLVVNIITTGDKPIVLTSSDMLAQHILKMFNALDMTDVNTKMLNLLNRIAMQSPKTRMYLNYTKLPIDIEALKKTANNSKLSDTSIKLVDEVPEYQSKHTIFMFKGVLCESKKTIQALYDLCLRLKKEEGKVPAIDNIPLSPEMLTQYAEDLYISLDNTVPTLFEGDMKKEPVVVKAEPLSTDPNKPNIKVVNMEGKTYDDPKDYFNHTNAPKKFTLSWWDINGRHFSEATSPELPAINIHFFRNDYIHIDSPSAEIADKIKSILGVPYVSLDEDYNLLLKLKHELQGIPNVFINFKPLEELDNCKAVVTEESMDMWYITNPHMDEMYKTSDCFELLTAYYIKNIYLVCDLEDGYYYPITITKADMKKFMKANNIKLDID